MPDWRAGEGTVERRVSPFPNDLKRAYRLKSSVDFQAVYAKGRSAANKAAVIYALTQKSSALSRIGFAAGKKLGKAVVRNRIKRRITEAVRAFWPRVKPGYYIIIIARHAAKDMAFPQLQARVLELFDRAGVVRPEG